MPARHARIRAMENFGAEVLSGPDPQRSYLEQILLEQARSMPQKFLFVLGQPGQTEQEYLAENLSSKQFFVVQQQGETDLKSALKKVLETKGLADQHFPANQVELTIKNWLGSL